MGNIFDEAARQEKNKMLKKKAASKSPGDSVSKPTPPSQRTENTEIKEIFQSIREMQSDLDHQFAEVKEQGKKHHVNVNKLIANTLSKEYEKVKEAELKLKNAVNIEVTPIASVAKSEDKLTKERKGKLRGARQKWIPM